MSESLKELQRVWFELAVAGEMDYGMNIEFENLHGQYMAVLDTFGRINKRLKSGEDSSGEGIDRLDQYASALEALERRMDEFVIEHDPDEPEGSWQTVEFDEVETGNRIRLVTAFNNALEEWTAVVGYNDMESINYLLDKDDLVHEYGPLYESDLPEGWRIERYVEA